ncbi:MAG: indole-3-glycerol phosphate synthase TrpC [Flavobacteriales bacterium]|nr:indole-3-glycerol phosphate synthase TrpC [Flavobacteriales bacterium]
MNKLEEIIACTRKRVTEQKEMYPEKLLEKSIYSNTPCVSLKKYLMRTDLHGIIAEFKRQSPSKGVLNNYAPVERTSMGYMQAGASALSILTEPQFFKGKNEDLTVARKFNYCPILRKDFTVSEYQIIEAKSIGADVVLLLASVLSKDEMKTFTSTAHSLALEVLVEIRGEEELENVPSDADIVGVNNRNLEDFSESIEQSIRMSEFIPKGFVKISESGIHEASTIVKLKQHGYRGFLIGGHFMQQARPEQACAQLIQELDHYP